eukprot:2134020-Heterocapsa_arctica.AAC.1
MSKDDAAAYRGRLEVAGSYHFSRVDLGVLLAAGYVNEAMLIWSTMAEGALVQVAQEDDPKYSKASYRGRGTLP